ncbi:MAG: hypothetical protein H6844_10570 [Alphaproteobacteria bacterium]|nr:hypothetical protein [Alphaproteobacteria bacterium]
MLRRAWRMLSGLGLPVLGLAAAVAALAPGYDARTLVPLTAAMLLAGAVDCAIAALRAQKREGSVAASALPANLALLAAVLLLEGRGRKRCARLAGGSGRAGRSFGGDDGTGPAIGDGGRSAG